MQEKIFVVLNFIRDHTAYVCARQHACAFFSRGNRPCPLCDTAPLDVSVLDHSLCEHCTELGLGLECTSELLVNRLVNLNISFLAKFRNLYSYSVT